MEELNALYEKRIVIRLRVTQFEKYLKSLQDEFKLRGILDDKEVGILKGRLKAFEVLYTEFNSLHNEIEASKFANAAQQIEERWTTETSFIDLIADANDLIDINETRVSFVRNSVVNTSATPPPAPSNDIRLPQIGLPSFNGQLKNWLEFKDTFRSMIHDNATLPNIQKFHYLRSVLVSEAAEVIKSISFSSDNYALAWAALLDRYDNDDCLIKSHLDAIFKLSPINRENSIQIRHIADETSKALRALKSLGEKTDDWDTIIVYTILGKVDRNTLREWSEYRMIKQAGNKKLTFADLKRFLYQKADLLSVLENANSNNNNSMQYNKSRNKTNTFFADSSNAAIVCVFCKKNNHMIDSCRSFLSLRITERIDEARKLHLCLNCLKYASHRANVCRAARCTICDRNHNTILHLKAREETTTRNAQPLRGAERTQSETNLHNSNASVSNENVNINSVIVNQTDANDCELANFTSASDNYVLLGTVLLWVQAQNGTKIKCRALLDSGSQSSFITIKMFNRLNIEKTSVNLRVTSLNGVINDVQDKCQVSIFSNVINYNAIIDCFIINKITGQLPRVRIDKENLKIPANIKLADPMFNEPGEIDLLIGAELFYDLFCVGQYKLGIDLPTLTKSKLGWVISGKINYNKCKVTENNYFNESVCGVTLNDLHAQLKAFWEIEELSENNEMSMSDEEKFCEEYFLKTFKRNADGRFTVSIPFKDDLSKLGESKSMAYKMFLNLENKFRKNNEFRIEYTKFMNEYEQLGHMSRVNADDLECEHVFYLPHHGVIKSDSLTTKLRAVFNASAKTSTGYSINDLQAVGPVLQKSLFSILLNFRQNLIVVIGDVSKMYRQIEIEPSQRSLQRIFWRADPGDELVILELNTVTYGYASSSFLAMRCFKQIADENKEQFPAAALAITDNFYVDDYLKGDDDCQSLINITRQVRDILCSAGFILTKWMSNSDYVVESLNADDSDKRASKIGTFNISDLSKESFKTLGIVYDPRGDEFLYSLGFEPKIITKRTILSTVAQIFDPLGLLSPCTIIGKIIMQSLWKLQLSWDETVPLSLHTQWTQFCADLKHIKDLRIPRCIKVAGSIRNEIHGFCDSSQAAYGCCVYLRSYSSVDSDIVTRLICAKTKVAPLKVQSIPRLELCAALRLALLIKEVTKSLTIKVDAIRCWSDSTIVLSWINSAPHNLKTFVANRISKIQDLTTPDMWSHVPTECNPADLLSRGIRPASLRSNSLWWNGPLFLKERISEWPVFSLNAQENVEEMRANVCVHTSVAENDFDIFGRFSSLNRLKRVVAYCYRFISSCKVSREHRICGDLTVTECEFAFDKLLIRAQSETFGLELGLLRSGKQILKGRLKFLNPFLDKVGLIRVGGRLVKADFEFDKRHPIVLDSKHDLTKLLFAHEHFRLLHAGPQSLLYSIRESFWPLSGRNLARATVRRCVACFRVSPTSENPIMAALPPQRTNPVLPFTVVGCDYGGPFQIKMNRGRTNRFTKGYICLFVCFVSRAIHLELVSELSAECFLAALRRFCSRRGKPSQILSDNGLNFIGAMRELKQFLDNSRSYLTNELSQQNISWHLIPPHSPHFGGLHEAGIKSTKSHLKRILGNTKLCFEDFGTVLTQVEAVLNSRPIMPMSDDPSDAVALSPGHFLIGKPLMAVPDADVQTINPNRLSNYQRLQQYQQMFWRRWSKEYVSELQQRKRWLKNSSALLKVGVMVVVKDDNAPPLSWPLGRIVELHPGSDGVVRVVSVLFANGSILKRAVVKVCVLPIDAVPASNVD